MLGNALYKSSKLHIVRNDKNDKRFPYLVVNGCGDLHLPTTFYIPYLSERFAKTTVRSYLSAVVAYLSWQANQKDCGAWDSDVETVQQQVVVYLLLHFKCQIKSHRKGFRLVELTENNASGVSLFLAALRNFYTAAINDKRYLHPNPLTDWRPLEVKEQDQGISGPRMPLVSGVSTVPKRARLTDSYFVVINNQWTPRVIDDPQFPALIINAGKQARWSEREFLIARLLFETGARVSEVCGLTLGDWHARGMENSATAFSKGSGKRRVKMVRWSSGTSKLLRQYFDTARVQYDRQKLTLAASLALNRGNTQALYEVPLFLSTRGSAMLANTFRDLYWRPACRQAGIDADIHQARHWYVTMSIREIYSSESSKDEVEKRVNDLIHYMNWKSGGSTLEAYEHFFSRQQHAEVQDALHMKLDRQLTLPRGLVKPPAQLPSKVNANPAPDPELDFLLRLGGQIDE